METPSFPQRIMHLASVAVTLIRIVHEFLSVIWIKEMGLFFLGQKWIGVEWRLCDEDNNDLTNKSNVGLPMKVQ